MEEIIIDKLEWTAPEYNHTERNPDWFWTIGLIGLVGFGLALWFHNYLFALFILVAGVSLFFFSLRAPHDMVHIIETKGITLGEDFFEWKKIKGFNLINKKPNGKLLIYTTKHFLPIYTLMVPEDLMSEVKETMLKISPVLEIEEPKINQFMEKMGF